MMRPILLMTALFAAAAAAFAAAEPAAVDVPLTLHVPEKLQTQRWPIVVGVPFAEGARHGLDDLRVVPENGAAVAAQITPAGRWADGSVRWAHVAFIADLSQRYRVTSAADSDAEGPAGPVVVERSDDGLSMQLAAGRFTFSKNAGCFTTMMLEDGSTLTIDAGEAFYVVDSRGRRATMQAASVAVEQEGPVHTVVRTEGPYVTDAGERVAYGRAYFHFFADFPGVKVSHKLIVTEETNDLWFRDIGMRVPLADADDVTATFNHDFDDPYATTPVAVDADATAAVLVQDDFPHFGSESSHYAIRRGDEVVREGAAAGDWVDVSMDGAGRSSGPRPGRARGLTVQFPAFAQQFPKAFFVTPDALTVKFWAGEETGRELDFRTEQIVASYFGHDWIPADSPLASAPNTARATSKTHDLWLYPHDGAFDLVHARTLLGATHEEIYAAPDPAWIAQSGAMDPFHPCDPEQFPRIEAVIRDYFLRHVIVPERIFPNTGYLAWGRNPYTSQAWELKDGKWYPTPHRLSRVLEYNLKRAVWVLYARSGDRLYRDYARRYSRFLHDFSSSNWDTNLKPLGWFVQGEPFDAVTFWGAFDMQTIRADEKPHFISTLTTLGYGTSEDVIQYVYDYFMAGDLHARDAARNYKDAFVKELGQDMDKLLTVAPSYVLLRPVASAYELDPDPQLYDFMHRYLEIIVGDGSDVLNMQVPQNYVKSGEIWAGFYHYYVSTRDELALQPLLRAAERYYRTNRIELIYRGSGMPQAFAYAHRETGDAAYLTHLAQAVHDFADHTATLSDRGIDPDTVTRALGEPWGHIGAITDASPVMIGIPVALGVMADSTHERMRVPLAIKPYPTPKTHLFFNKERDTPARIDLYVNNFGDLTVQPALFDLEGKAVPLRIVEEESHRVDKPHGDASWQWKFNQFYGTFGTHMFFQLEVDAPPGIYRLDSGDAVAMAVLYSDMTQFAQLAPQGLVLQADRPYHFPVPAGVDAVELFAHRAVEVFDPAGEAIALEALGDGRHRFAVAGKTPEGSLWRLQTGTDELVYDHPFTKVDALVRFENIPTILASDDPARLAGLAAALGQRDATTLMGPTPQTPEMPGLAAADAAAEPAHVSGPKDQALWLPRGHIVELADLPEGTPPPHAQGTIEFYIAPDWTTAALHLDKPADAHVYVDLLRFDPITITYRAHARDNGRSPAYLQSYFDVRLQQKEGGAVSYPVIAMLERGRWHHVAVTWNVDGQASDIEVFIDGRRKTYAHYRDAVPSDMTADNLEAPATKLQFGSAVTAAPRLVTGFAFDHLRISRNIRYQDDFNPAESGVASDAETYLLLPLDSDLRVITPNAGAALVATPGKAAKLR